MFIALLSFSRYLTTNFVSLNKEPCMIRPFLIDLNPFELKYYPFMISLDNCKGSCNCVDDLSTRISIWSKTKDKTKNRNEAKTLVKEISCDWKW